MWLFKFIGRCTRAILRKAGYELVRPEQMNPAASRRAAILRYHRIQTVLDVGANMGQFGSELRLWGFEGRINSFEPTSVAFEALSKLASSDAQWRVFNFAIGAEDGVAEINVASNLGASSSFMPMLDPHKQCAPEIEYVTTERVRVRSLDGALADVITQDETLMLKMDVQGFEHFVLSGATAILQQVKVIECELSFVSLYEGQLLFPQMLALLDTLGFQPVSFNPVLLHPVSGHALQLDGIFARV
jgi:FkbM family methyltransferase